MKFFNECTTLAEVKATYKKLALQYHPDRGGDTATMQAINNEYAYASARLINDANMSQEKTEEELRFSDDYKKVLEQIIHLPFITIELVGLWIWVTGNTRPVKTELRNAGLFYASKKEAWYYRRPDLKQLRGGKKSLDEIRGKYGSSIISESKRKSINKFN